MVGPFLEEAGDPLPQVVGVLRPDELTDAPQRRLEPLIAEGLQQVVERVGLEGLDRVLVVGRDEHGHRHQFRLDLAQHAEAVQHRHLDVEEHQVRRLGVNQVEGLAAVAGDADHLDVGLPLQKLQQPAPGGAFVIDDERADDIHDNLLLRLSSPSGPSADARSAIPAVEKGVS